MNVEQERATTTVTIRLSRSTRVLAELAARESEQTVSGWGAQVIQDAALQMLAGLPAQVGYPQMSVPN